MANDNVKIIIQEVDETSPRGAGTSSDVAYVPGLATEDILRYDYNEANGKYDLPVYAKKNVPILCNTVTDFEAYFGKTPYTMTELDVTGTQYSHSYQVGDYDKSYLYAKELLTEGMSVIYENISVENELRNIAVVNAVNFPEKNCLEDNGNNTFTYTGCANVKETQNYTFNFIIAGGNPTYGAATVMFDLPTDKDLKITVSDITAESTAGDLGFTFVQNKKTIKWQNLTAADFKYTVFTVKLAITYSGKDDGRDYTIGINVVDGEGITEGAIAAGSKIGYLYDHLSDALEVLEDKNEYSVKYITSGGYPTFIPIKQKNGGYDYALATKMLSVASNRGDAVALVDHNDQYDAPLAHNHEDSIYHEVNEYFANTANTEFGAMFTPYGTYTCATAPDLERTSQIMPASFGYMMCVAKAIKTSPNWLAMAGVTRGLVPNLKSLHTAKILSNVIAENYQPKFGSADNKVSINAITNVKPYGLTIWGNRTLQPVKEKGTVALNFLNTRNMVSDIKKVAYSTAKSLMFEQDSDVLWLKFKSGVTPLLEQLKSGYGISDYKVIKSKTKYDGTALTRGEMAAVIKVYPLYAIEYFEITVVLTDDDVTVK